MSVTVETDGAWFRGLAVPFHQSAYVVEHGDVIEEVFDELSLDLGSLPKDVPLLVGHRRDHPPAGIVRTSAVTRYGLGVEGELVGSDDELEGWRRRFRNDLSARLSIGFTSDVQKARWQRPVRAGFPPRKTPRGVRVVEISLVHWPAYETAGIVSLSARSAADERRHEESERIIHEWNTSAIVERGRRRRAIREYASRNNLEVCTD